MDPVLNCDHFSGTISSPWDSIPSHPEHIPKNGKRLENARRRRWPIEPTAATIWCACDDHRTHLLGEQLSVREKPEIVNEMYMAAWRTPRQLEIVCIVGLHKTDQTRSSITHIHRKTASQWTTKPLRGGSASFLYAQFRTLRHPYYNFASTRKSNGQALKLNIKYGQKLINCQV